MEYAILFGKFENKNVSLKGLNNLQMPSENDISTILRATIVLLMLLIIGLFLEE